MLYLFKNIKNKDINNLLLNYQDKNLDELKSLLYDFSLKNSLDGNILKKYILYTFIYNENYYTLKLERNKKNDLDLNALDNDLNEFYKLYNLNINLDELNDFKLKNTSNLSIILDKMINKIKSFDSFKKEIINYYKTNGVGDISLFKAFRINDSKLIPIEHVLNVSFDDLIGYDLQKELLIENTINFINNKPYNNVLLYGDSGTGKSTSIKALINKFFDKGLRIVEIYKHEIEKISQIISKLKERPYHFIIYMDDLSFEESEVEYKYLKSVIEGGIEEKPSNVVVYATSNRRHLIKETFKDNGDVFDDLHRNETQAEKLSLAYRFGLQIYYGSLSPEEFRNMVKELAERNDINLDEKTLILEASKFELTYGSLSGRCAQQFISYIANKYN